MIGRLTGTLCEKQPPLLLVDVNGVGYEVSVPMSTLYHLPELGQKVVLHTHFLVREDAQLLYGFHTVAERQLFRELIKVSGIGAKIALAILSGMDLNTIVLCISEGDSALLSKIPGIGKKTAERLIVEMRGRLADGLLESDVASALGDLPAPLSVQAGPAVEQDAIAALVALGYKRTEMVKKVAAAAKQAPDAGSDELIRRVLKERV